jgi:hypothetical protein
LWRRRGSESAAWGLWRVHLAHELFPQAAPVFLALHLPELQFIQPRLLLVRFHTRHLHVGIAQIDLILRHLKWL